MGTEIERKFIVVDDRWRDQVRQSTRMSQCYLRQGDANSGPEVCSVRIRIEGEQANLNIKQSVPGPERLEYEYPIPLADAREMFSDLVMGGKVEKIRHVVHAAGQLWEVDEFLGDNSGLTIAEIELCSIDEVFERPAWIGAELTDDRRYYNRWLAQHPYSQWERRQ